jgi:hypothetical protein
MTGNRFEVIFELAFPYFAMATSREEERLFVCHCQWGAFIQYFTVLIFLSISNGYFI